MSAMPALEPTLRIDAHSPHDRPTVGLVELMLKNPKQLDLMIRDERQAPEMIPRLVAVALAGLTIFGVAVTVVINLAEKLPAWIPSTRWSDGTWGSLTLAYVLGMIAANGVCLPSFYFYGLLAGVRLTMLQTAAHAIKCLAMGAVMLVGILPIYVALALGVAVSGAAADWIPPTIGLGLALPFLSGFYGVCTLYNGFVSLADTLPRETRHRRGVFLEWMTLAWAACYSVVTPLMIYWLWTHFAGR